MTGPTTRFSRRQFLLAATAGLIAGCASNGRSGPAVSRRTFGPEPEWLGHLIGDRDSAARLGQAYLDAHPEYRQGDRLISAVEKKLPGQAPIPEAQGSTAFAEALQQQVLREYARDEVEVVSGWVLSITESRLYALAALVQQFD
jgi:hypothetical protein